MSKKSIMILFVIVIVTIVLIYLIGLSNSNTYQDRQGVYFLSVSNDGTQLLTITGNIELERSLLIYDISSEEIILDESPSEFPYSYTPGIKKIHGYDIGSYLSPDGKYFIKNGMSDNEELFSLIFNSTNGELIKKLPGHYSDWSSNNHVLVTIGPTLKRYIQIWNTTDFSNIKIIDKIVTEVFISWNGTILVNINYYDKNDSTIIKVMEISNETLIDLWQTETIGSGTFCFSENGFFFQMIQNDQLLVWNVSTGEIITEESLDYSSHELLLSSIFGKYIVYDNSNDSISIYNFSELEKTIHINPSEITSHSLSRDGSIIVLGYKTGLIEIWDAQTGELIKTLKTPIREISFGIPSLELIAIMYAIVVFFFLKNGIKKID